jgi:hypothetical protein
MTEKIKYLVSTHNLTGVDLPASLFYGVDTYCRYAERVGSDGIEFVPTRVTQRQVFRGELTDEQLEYVCALGQSFRGERTPFGFLRPLLRGEIASAKNVLGAYLVYPFIGDTRSLRGIQEKQPDIPVILQTPDEIERTEGLNNRILIVNPETMKRLGVDQVGEVGPRAKEMGFNGGLCIDPFQMQREGSPEVLARLKDSVFELWPYAGIVHLSFARDDFKPGERIKPVQELRDIFDGNESTPIYATLGMLREQYQSSDNSPPIVLQIPYGGVDVIRGKATLSGAVEVGKRVLGNVREVLE